MTKEEAIVIMENEKPHCGRGITFTEEEKYEAYNMAIAALRGEPCDADAEASLLTPDERADVLNSVEDAVEKFNLTVGGYEDNDGVFFKIIVMKGGESEND